MQTHKPPFLLKELKIEVTHKCPLKCCHCSSVSHSECEREMRWDDCRRIIYDATDVGVDQIAFSGGEPLLWGDLEKAVQLASERNCNVTLYTSGHTSGLSTIARIKNLRDKGLYRAIFSLYSSNPIKHDSITGVDGSFGITTKIIEESAQSGMETEIHFVPTAQNFLELSSVVELSSKLGSKRVSVLRLVPQGRAKNQKEMLLSYDQNQALRMLIFELRNKGHDIRVGSPYNFLMARDNPKCCAAIDRLTISPDLSISPCDAFKHIRPSDLGITDEYCNLSKHSIKDCWAKSSLLNLVRTYLTTPFADECSKCGSIESCTSGCLAQKIIQHGFMKKVRDPMCLKI